MLNSLETISLTFRVGDMNGRASTRLASTDNVEPLAHVSASLVACTIEAKISFPLFFDKRVISNFKVRYMQERGKVIAIKIAI